MSKPETIPPTISRMDAETLGEVLVFAARSAAWVGRLAPPAREPFRTISKFSPRSA